MARKRTVRHYGDYTQIINGELYAAVNLPLGNGKYKKRYKKVSNKTEALQWALGKLEEHKKGSSYDESLTFEEFAEWYKREFLHAPHYEKGLKVSGVKDYERLKNKIDVMTEFFGSRKMKDFSEYDLHRWQNYRRDVGKVLTATINRDFSLLRTMFKRGFRFRKIERIPEFNINLSAETERSRVMSFDEEKRILAACVETETIEVKSKSGKYSMTIDAKRAHLKPIIILALDTALRLNEIFTLTWSDIDFDKETITVKAQNAKTQKSRVIGMTPRVKILLNELPKTGEKVFRQKSPVRAFRTACRRAGVEDLHFHDLRHSAITRMIRAGIPHAEVMKVSGHTQFRTFSRYLNMQQDGIKNAASKLGEFIDSQL